MISPIFDFTTVSGERFPKEDSALLALLIYRRFGRNAIAATAAWRRLLMNDCRIEEFQRLIDYAQTLHGVEEHNG